jgi:hypothetical protein
MQELAEPGYSLHEVLSLPFIHGLFNLRDLLREHPDNIDAIKKQNYSLYYSGHSSKTGQASTGFILLKKMQNYVIGFESYNERLCKLRLKGKYNNIMLINIYAPT